MSTVNDRRRHLASAAFVALLMLSVFWPSPVVSTNLLCCNAPLAVDDLSFLGREAPSWDIVFWWIGGLILIAMLQSGETFSVRGLGWSRSPAPRIATIVVWIAAAAIVVAVIWRFADAPILAWAESVQSEAIEDAIRVANRFGGGMNPGLIVIFFFIAGVVYRHTAWARYAIAMAIAGAGAGILGQIVKFAVGRMRPELWLGPFEHARAAATSFPSGHTIGAFALAGVLLFASRNLPLRVVAVALAFAVGLARVLAFRHWPSDVAASACLGLIAAAIVTAVIPAGETTSVSERPTPAQTQPSPH